MNNLWKNYWLLFLGLNQSFSTMTNNTEVILFLQFPPAKATVHNGSDRFHICMNYLPFSQKETITQSWNKFNLKVNFYFVKMWGIFFFDYVDAMVDMEKPVRESQNNLSNQELTTVYFSSPVYWLPNVEELYYVQSPKTIITDEGKSRLTQVTQIASNEYSNLVGANLFDKLALHPPWMPFQSPSPARSSTPLFALSAAVLLAPPWCAVCHTEAAHVICGWHAAGWSSLCQLIILIES